jgi:hypothetical protein
MNTIYQMTNYLVEQMPPKTFGETFFAQVHPIRLNTDF